MSQFRIVQVGATDVEGARFNGQELHQKLIQRGIESSQVVWRKRGTDDTTYEMFSGALRSKIDQTAAKLERDLSLQSLLSPLAFEFAKHPQFKAADLAHYHLIHTGFFNLMALPGLTQLKPSVWTLHDPWAMTGHCVHPFDCTRWKEGCGSCPSLDNEFSMKRDNTRLMWRIKQLAYCMSDFDLIVCSKWMEGMVKASPLMKKARLHRIPLGVDLNAFQPGDSQAKKQKLGVYPGNLVVALRATTSIYKGLPHAIECLRKLDTKQPLTILTFNQKGLFEEFFGKYQIIDLGWLESTEEMIDAYQSADIFLMPSEGESFGMMAVEAMACGKPSIIFDGTALPETTFAPEYGVSVRKGDSDALAHALKGLLENESKRLSLGEKGRKLAVQHYGEKEYVDRVIALYTDVLARRGSKASAGGKSASPLA
ncbi:MAG: glycosyltransferase [Candidatus Melainabacteria bacterium]|nr:glycosyltransferase [Candidatus Melainabacteria bacterium]